MTMFAVMSGTAACSGSAITLTLWYPPILRSLPAHGRDARLNNPNVPSPYPPGAQLFFRAVTAIHESAFALRLAFAICNLAIVYHLARCLASYRASSALDSGVRLEPAAGDGGSGQRSHRYSRCTAAGGVLRCSATPLAHRCSCCLRAGGRREISPDCAAAALLATHSHS